MTEKHDMNCAINYGFRFCNCKKDSKIEHIDATNYIRPNTEVLNTIQHNKEILGVLKELRNKIELESRYGRSDEIYCVPLSWIDECFEEMEYKYKCTQTRL